MRLFGALLDFCVFEHLCRGGTAQCKRFNLLKKRRKAVCIFRKRFPLHTGTHQRGKCLPQFFRLFFFLLFLIDAVDFCLGTDDNGLRRRSAAEIRRRTQRLPELPTLLGRVRAPQQLRKFTKKRRFAFKKVGGLTQICRRDIRLKRCF